MRTTPRITVVMALAFCLVLTIATTAGAKFTSHNGADLTQTDVVQGSEFNTCGDRISGLIGWGTTLTLEQLGGSLPPEATGPADYEVFRFPPGANPLDYSAVFDPQHRRGPPVRTRGQWHRRGYRAEDPDLHVG